jgi:outer membrane lipoprotein-sorting protein
MFKNILISLLPMLLVVFAPATFAKASAKGAKEVNSILAAYRKAPAIQAKIKKTVVQEAMGTETKGQGEFYFSKGKLRMDIQTPEKSTLVYDGKYVWYESRMEGLDGDGETIQVSKMKMGKLKKTDSLMATLFEEKDILRNFKLISAKQTKASGKVFVFEPRNKAKTEVQHLEIGIKNGNIDRIMYRDQVENKVAFEFSDLKRAAVPAGKFKYTVPKKAEVTEL